jgi:chromosome partitioning protein
MTNTITKRTRTIAVANQKGGVGKTTTTYHLVRAALLQGLKVLAVDADPQGNLTAALRRDDMEQDIAGLVDVLSSGAHMPLLHAVAPTVWAGVDLIPTQGEGLSVVGAELMATSTGREFRLRDALEVALGEMGDERYDLVLIDCPPALDQLTVNALVAADSALIVTHTRLWSMDGLSRLLANIADVKKYLNPGLSVAGIVVNQHEKATNSARSRKLQLENAVEGLGVELFEPVVPKRTVIGDAPEAGAGLDDYGAEAQSLVDIYDRYITRLMDKEK